MFYCDPCAKKKKWPVTGFQSYGPCEVCGITGSCSDLPSSMLPDPQPEQEISRWNEERKRYIGDTEIHVTDIRSDGVWRSG